MKFSALSYLLNKDNLFECYGMLKRGKACGMDRVSMEADDPPSLRGSIEGLSERDKGWREQGG
jgi:hypothetical protein